MMDHQDVNGQDQLSQAKPCPGSLQSANKMPTKGLGVLSCTEWKF